MKFLVICRAMEPPPPGLSDQMELLEANQRRLADGADARIVQALSFAGERAFAIVVETPTARELEASVFETI